MLSTTDRSTGYTFVWEEPVRPAIWILNNSASATVFCGLLLTDQWEYWDERVVRCFYYQLNILKE